MSKWTAGPWKVAKINHGILVKTESECRTKYGASRYAAIGGFDRSDEKQLSEAIANAHLVAAAPELYEVLLAMVALSGHTAGNDPEGAVIAQAQAALAKARGE